MLKSAGKDEMLKCSLYALKIISLAQNKQSQLMDRCRNKLVSLYMCIHSCKVIYSHGRIF